MEDPGEGLSSLNRQLSLLTPREEEVAKGLAAMGEEARATTFILDRLGRKLGDLGVKEAAGVAGAFDTLIERIGRFLEIAGEAGGILQPITDSFGRMSKELEKVNKGLKDMPLGLRVVGQIIRVVTKTFEVFVFNLDIITSTLGILLVIKLVFKLVAAFKILIATVTIATAGMKALAIVSAIANPWFLLAGAVAAVAIKMKFFNDEVDRTTAGGLSKEIVRIKGEIKKLEKSLTGLVLGGDFLDTSPSMIRLQNLRKELKKVEDAAAKLDIEKSLSVEKFKTFSDDEENALSPKVQAAIRDLNNELLLLGPNVTDIQRKMIELAKTFGGTESAMELFVKDGILSFRFLKGTFKKLGEDTKKVLGEITEKLKAIAESTFINKERADALASAFGRIETPKGFQAIRLELQAFSHASLTTNMTTEQFTETWNGLRDAIQDFNDERGMALASDMVKRYAANTKLANRITNESKDVLGTAAAALRNFNAELTKLEMLRDEGFIGQETFTNRLRKMHIELAKNTEGAQEFSSTIASGMAAGIMAGDSLRDTLAKIGDQLIEASIRALIFKGIMQSIGFALGGGGASSTTANAADRSDISSTPSDFNTLSTGPTIPTGLSNPPPASLSRGGGGQNTIINIDARASDPGVEQRVLRAMNAANREQTARINRSRAESRRRI